MALLISGLLVWSVIHLIPSAWRPLRTLLVSRLGEKLYSGLFAVTILLSLALMIFGWRSITPNFLYVVPEGVRSAAIALVILAYILMGAAVVPTRIKQWIRHPQLTGVALWAGAHIILNGDSRSMVLFGGMLIWSILSIIFINQRDGQWIKPEIPSAKQEVIAAVVIVAMFAITVLLHPHLSGVALL